MQLLLDTHSFLWFVSENDKLSQQAKEAIALSPQQALRTAGLTS